MSEKQKDIIDIIKTTCQSGPEMASKLKVIGDGDMHEGLVKIASNYKQVGFNSGKSSGLKGGVVIGTTVTLAIIAAYNEIKKMIDAKKKQKDLEINIVSAIETAESENVCEADNE